MSGPYGDFHGLRTEIGDLSAVLVMLAGIVWVFRAMRRGEYNETELERQLDNRGFFYRFFGRWMKVISKRWQMYPAGVIFGLASTPHRGPAPDDHRVPGL